MADRLLTVEQVAERLNVRARTVRKWIFEDRLPRVKLGRLVRILESDLENFVRAGRIEVSPTSSYDRREASSVAARGIRPGR